MSATAHSAPANPRERPRQPRRRRTAQRATRAAGAEPTHPPQDPDDRVLTADLCDRFLQEIAAALQDAARARAQLSGLPNDGLAPDVASALVRRLDAAADRCRSATHHIACATRAASEIARMGR